jgi:hypothetical protein
MVLSSGRDCGYCDGAYCYCPECGVSVASHVDGCPNGSPFSISSETGTKEYRLLGILNLRDFKPEDRDLGRLVPDRWDSVFLYGIPGGWDWAVWVSNPQVHVEEYLERLLRRTDLNDLLPTPPEVV